MKSRRFAKVVAALFVFAAIGLSLYEMAAGPHCFAFNPVFGYFPGPIYDRVVAVSPALVAFRAANLVTAVFLGCFLSITLKIAIRRQKPQTPRPKVAELFIGAACLIFLLVFSAHRADLGLTSSDRIILKELSGLRETEHFVIHYPPDGPVADQIDLIAADHEFRFAQICSELDLRFTRKVQSYIYRNDDQKKRLQGAGPTMYADVSNAAIHMSQRDFPHHVLKHEMTHVLAAVWGIPYFGWSAKVGLTEGVAVAVEGYRGEGSIHQWAAAMKRLDRLPDIVTIMGPVGFWGKISSRSYLAAGSFSLWLMDTEGVDRYREMFTWGSFESTYSEPLDSLRDAWLEFLDTVDVSDRLMKKARHKFFRRSLFEQRCAREVARLLDAGWRKYRKGLYHEALARFSRAADLAPDNPKAARGLMLAYIGAKDYDRGEQIAKQIVIMQGGQEVLSPDYTGVASARPVIRALAETARLDWMRGRLDTAERTYEQILQVDFDDAYTRLAVCALHALRKPTVEPFVRRYLASELDEPMRVYYLTQAVKTYGKDPILRYLLGRKLVLDEQYVPAISHLLEALSHEDLAQVLRNEGLFSLARALYFEKRFAEALVVLDVMQNEPISQGKRLEVAEWIARVRFTDDYLSAAASFGP